MAASAWDFFNGFKRELGLGNVPLDGTGVVYRMVLLKSSAQLSAAAASAIGSLTGTVNTSGFSSRALANVNWSVKTTTSTFSWTWDTVIWTAQPTAINSISYAVIYMQTASTLVCWSRLSTAAFNVAKGNLYVIEPNPNAFELN